MDVECFYCNSCGCEEFDIKVDYVRTVANGGICLCPGCGEEVICDEEDVE